MTHSREEIVSKLTKWYVAAQEATSRKTAQKALKKTKKHAKRLSALYDMSSSEPEPDHDQPSSKETD
jgi:hypothetical protein